MNLEFAVKQLAHNAQIITHTVADVSQQQAQWRPDDSSWSILEVINHLLDEEREDFRQRLDFLLHKPGHAWPPIDPVGWVVQRDYNSRDLQESITSWRQEREASLAWLKQLGHPDWTSEHPAPWGVMRPGDMLAAWVAHDLLHMRQLVELRYAFTTESLTPYLARYAGDW